MSKHTMFFGDGEHTFAMPFPLIKELQETTGVTIGVLFQRVRSLTFGINDIAETIRLGLIGGGAQPAQAFRLVELYVKQRPLAETLPVALSILELVWFGSPTDAQDETGHDADQTDAANLTVTTEPAGDLAAKIRDAYKDVSDE